MEIRILKNFLTAAEEGNLTSAANALHMSQSTLSRQMLELEQELDTQLFRRTNRNSELTDDGIRFRERVREIVSLSEQTLDEFQNRDRKLSGVIRIAVEECGAVDVLADLIVRFHEKHPDVRFEIRTAGTGEASQDLTEDNVDLALLLEPFDTGSFNTINLQKQEELGILMREDDPSASPEKIGTEMIRQMKLLVFNRYIDPRFPRRLNVSRRHLHTLGTYTSLSSAASLVRAGFADALCIRPAYRIDGLVFRPLTPAITCDAYLASRKFHVLSPQAMEFLKEIREQEKQTAE